MKDQSNAPKLVRTWVHSLQYILGPMRPRFLILALACVFLGLATAIRTGAYLNTWHVVLVFIGGVAAHACVNILNEYSDFLSGLDAKTVRTPFSGGSGILPAHPEMARAVLVTGIVMLGIIAGIGLFFLWLHGMALLPLGLLGLIVIIAYTPGLTHNPFLCLIAPGLGFGPLMVVGTQIALIGHSTLTGWVSSLVPFFLVSDLLLLNQFPDVEADRSVGRKHVLVVLGPEKCSIIYVLFLAAPYVAIIAGVVLGYLPSLSLLGLATILLAFPTAKGVLRFNTDIPRLIPSLIMNVVINLVTPVLLAVGLIFQR